MYYYIIIIIAIYDDIRITPVRAARPNAQAVTWSPVRAPGKPPTRRTTRVVSKINTGKTHGLIVLQYYSNIVGCVAQ